MMSNEETPPADAGRGLSEGLGLAPEREGQPRFYTAVGPVPEEGHWYSPAAVRELLAAERERRVKLPRLPTPRLLASGTIAGKRIELHGWHTEDIEIWQRQHGLKFGA
jgi:hypothetical protein